MKDRSTLRTLAIAALAVAAAAAIAVGAYNAGFAHGIAESGRAITAPPAGGAYPYVWARPWGIGFFPVFPFFFALFLFFVLRGFLWRGPWHGRWASGYDGVPPVFDEWHRRAHGEQPLARPTTGNTT